MAYHKREIAKGTLGELSKIQEELDELKDAEDQGIVILSLCELSDLYGAIEAYVQGKFPGFTMGDIKLMSNATRAAFADGSRS